MKMINSSLFTSNKHDWCTPQKLFDEWNAEFLFTLDAAATPANAKCKKYFTPEDDALNQNWAGNTVFLNPPYGKSIGQWVKKAYEESQKPKTTVVMLIPSRTDTAYFHDYILDKAEIRFIRGRIKFTNDEGKSANSAPFPSIIIIYKGKET